MAQRTPPAVDVKGAPVFCALASDAANGFTAGGGGVFITLVFATSLNLDTYLALSIAFALVEVAFGVFLLLAVQRFASTRAPALRRIAISSVFYALLTGLILPVQSVIGTDKRYFPARYGTLHWWEFLADPAVSVVFGVACRRIIAMYREELDTAVRRTDR